MDKISDFNIKRSRGHYILYNRVSKTKGHTHIKTKRTCNKLTGWICDKTVPISDYLKVSAIRLSRDEKYVKKVKDELKQSNSRLFKKVVEV